MSIFQDMGQINTVFGRDRAHTIVTNHRAKVILSGPAPTYSLLVDGQTADGKLIDLTRAAKFHSLNTKVAEVSATGVVRAAGDGATQITVEAGGQTLRVPVQVSEKRDASGEFRWIVADATLAPLTNGDYAIEVALGPSKQVTAFRVVP